MQQLKLRVLDSVYARQAFSRQFTKDGHFFAFPDNHWDVVVFRRNDRVTVLRTALGTDDVLVRTAFDREYRIRLSDGHIATPSNSDAPATPIPTDATFLGAFDFDWLGDWRFFPASGRTDLSPQPGDP